MLEQIKSYLAPVRNRQRGDRAIRWGTWGVLVGVAVCLGLLVVRWTATPVASTTLWMVLAATSAVGAIAGLLWPVGWHGSARLVDGFFNLKDRTATALAFAQREQRQSIHDLQVEDALARLSAVDATSAAPIRAPRTAPYALTAVIVLLALMFVGYPPEVTNANVPSEPLPVVLEQAAVLEETLLEELKELAEETEDAELEKLAEEMKQGIEDLKKPEVDEHEALAELSEMQAALNAAMKQLETQKVDAELQQLAEALQDADATQAASQELKESDYEGAAKELEKIDASTMSRKQKDALSSNLAKLSNKLGKGKPSELSKSVQQISEGLENENSSQCKSGFCDAAGVCRKQGVKKRISECLACQLNRLAECKSCCNGQCNKPGSKVAKTKSPSNSAGSGASNNPYGDEKTNLESQRREENLTGLAGDGPSERETLASSEARQDAARGYRERYAEYRKQMEEVIDSEPLPLGHRETVRKYFESIRPTSEQAID